MALALLIVTVPLSGLAPAHALPTLLPALILVAAQAPLITLTTTAIARNKVEGLAVLKLLGVIPTAIAPAMWLLPAPADWLLTVLPPYWAVHALWHPTPAGLLAGALLTALLLRRTLHRLTG